MLILFRFHLLYLQCSPFGHVYSYCCSEQRVYQPPAETAACKILQHMAKHVVNECGPLCVVVVNELKRALLNHPFLTLPADINGRHF